MRLSAYCLAIALFWPLTAVGQDAADAHFDPGAMQAARDALYRSHGDALAWMVLGERLERRSAEGDAELAWEGQGWFGGDLQKLWLKSEAEYSSAEDRLEEFELQALYSRAIHPFWDLQIGIRHDFKPDPTRSYAVLGLQGLAPYWFELDGALFVSERGDVSARFEAEYELRLTQRLMLQPRLEVNAAFSDDEAIAIGSGISSAQSGLRLRYEVTRAFAPYVGVSWSKAFGDTADFLEDATTTSWVAGLRFWF